MQFAFGEAVEAERLQQLLSFAQHLVGNEVPTPIIFQPWLLSAMTVAFSRKWSNTGKLSAVKQPMPPEASRWYLGMVPS